MERIQLICPEAVNGNCKEKECPYFQPYPCRPDAFRTVSCCRDQKTLRTLVEVDICK